MKTGAVIVAAGMSSRMGSFKPMLQIGPISVIKRVVSTLQQAGAELVVVVTGNQADVLEKHLSRSGVVFVRNEDYANTQMFDSVKIGLNYIKDRCDRILFTPVDVPLFTAKTVSELFKNTADIVIPVCDGREGHPLLIRSTAVPIILNNDGRDGLRGAFKAENLKVEYMSVDDECILYDIDTPSDYEELIKRNNSQLFRPVLYLCLAREDMFFGPEEAMLLRLISETSSVKIACSRMKLSYSKGWNTLRKISLGVGAPVTRSNQGGAYGGSTTLTEKGEWILERFIDFESNCQKYADKSFKAHFHEEKN